MASAQSSSAFVGAAWLALIIGVAMYLTGLFNATMALNEKGCYLTLLLYGLFAAVSVQKSTRDRLEGIAVTPMYYGLCWLSVIAAIGLLTVGLVNATIAPSEKGLYAMSFVLSLFAAITVQKNVRDSGAAAHH
ncbi:inner membrane protein YiaA [Massilia sp. PWRC2]|uniref:inner membrane protein YiaA n=1 Tax=Massilia sp. PWRC2 TaxID=2804626 RepID=UPI003CF0819A